MMKLAILTGAVVLASAVAWTGCTTVNNDGPDADAGPGGSSSGASGGSSGAAGDGGASSSGGSSGASSSSGGSSGGGGTATSCSSATMLAGNPDYDGEFQVSPESGTGIRTGQPLEWHDLVFDGQKLYSRNNDGELWMSDLSAAAPVQTRLTAKDDPASYKLQAGACATARFAQIRGMGRLADGSLVVADKLGNSIMHIADPAGAGCTTEYWAGNHTDGTDLDPGADYPNHGDVAGAGAAAKFDGLGALDVDAADNIYVWDANNRKIKKIAADAAHTVSDVSTIPTGTGPDRIFALTHVGTKLYAGGNSADGTNFILAVDMAGGPPTELVKSAGGEKFDPLDLNQGSAIPTALTTDGTGLIVQGLGYMWYVTTAGVVTNIAGTGVFFDQPAGYDPAAPQTAATFHFLMAQGSYNSGSITYVTYHDGAVYYRGRNLTSGAFVERISCP